MEEQEPTIALGADANEVLSLAELEARRAGSEEVGLGHVVLALARHPKLRAVLVEVGLSYERLARLLEAEASAGPMQLSPAQDVAEMLQKADELRARESPGGEISGGHLLRAILEGESPVGQKIVSESGIKVCDLIERLKVASAPAETPPTPSALERMTGGLTRLGKGTVVAFAWSALWAWILYFLLSWGAGPEFRDRWFVTILMGIGLLAIVACALYGMRGKLKRRETSGEGEGPN